ncbi:hypothetical protein FACS1894198_5540 [Clostridia bacterium]|nr:hypothetical protein FACS1894198_5540 [Clostridia bacterium]
MCEKRAEKGNMPIYDDVDYLSNGGFWGGKRKGEFDRTNRNGSNYSCSEKAQTGNHQRI